jgi:hypothetical protein
MLNSFDAQLDKDATDLIVKGDEATRGRGLGLGLVLVLVLVLGFVLEFSVKG